MEENEVFLGVKEFLEKEAEKEARLLPVVLGSQEQEEPREVNPDPANKDELILLVLILILRVI